MDDKNLRLPIPIIETIKKRKSVRTYDNRDVSLEDKEKIVNYIDKLNNPFGISVRIDMADKKLNKNGEKLGTYGVVKGASTFIGVSILNEELAPLAAGYEFENLILYATHLGLGTVWMAATFTRESFIKSMGLKENELLLAISPIGYPSEKPRVFESIMRSTLRSSSRKPWSSLFYYNDFDTPLTEDIAGDYSTALEMLRLAPSAKNDQPWRVLKSGNNYHFYINYSSNVSEEEALIKQVDLGIGLSHFHQIVMDKSLEGEFVKLPQNNINIPKDTHYIISWTIK